LFYCIWFIFCCIFVFCRRYNRITIQLKNTTKTQSRYNRTTIQNRNTSKT
jgi:hypothetical protein